MTVVFTCRADFYGHVLGYRPLVDRIQRGCPGLRSARWTSEELRQVIEAPAAKVGLEFEPGLPQRILGDMGQEPGRLPLLSFLLEQLWKQRRGAVLTNEAYDAMGGVDGAIATVAEDVFTKLPERDQERLPRLFIQLVSVGEESEDTRRRAPMTTLGEEARPLIGESGHGPALGHQLRAGHRDGGGRPRGPDSPLEPLERLGQRRPRLPDLAEAAGAVRGRVAELNRDRTALLRGGLLAEAQRWLAERPQDLDAPEREFIEASIRQQEREKQAEAWRKRFLVGLSIAAVVAAFLAVASQEGNRGQERSHCKERKQGEGKGPRNLAREPGCSVARCSEKSFPQRSVLLAAESYKIMQKVNIYKL